MCGSLHHEGRAKMIGSKVVAIKESGQLVVGRWTGFARAERLDTIWRNRLDFGVMKADDYIEKGQIFSVPSGYGIKVGIITKAMETLGDTTTRWSMQYTPGNILIITRPAITPIEKKIHDRHPVFIQVK